MTRKPIKKIRNFLAITAIVFLSIASAKAQTIQGTFAVTVGPTYTYTYDAGILITGTSWIVSSLGTVTGTSVVGTTYTATVVWNTAGTTSIKFKSTRDGILDTESVTVTSCSISAPTLNSASFSRCGAGTLTLLATPGSGGNTVKWYSALTGGTLLATGTSYTTPSQSSSGATYYVTSYNTTTSCETTRSATPSVTINSIPTAPTVSASVTSICGSGSVTLTGSAPSGTIVWYTNNTSGTINDGGPQGPSYSPTVSATTTYYAGVYLNGCETAPGNRNGVGITVKTIPNAAASNQTICSGQASAISITNPNGVSGTTFSWTVAQSNVTGASSGSGATIAQTLTATTTTAGTATYTITPTANGCTGTAITATVTVNPLPNASANSQTICSGTATAISISSDVASTSFSWTAAPSNGALSGYANGSGASIVQTLSNSSNANYAVTYTVTPTANGCAGTAITPYATVTPLPVASASNIAICSGANTNINPTTNIVGTVYNWTVSQSNTSGASNSSGGAIGQILTATTTSAGSAIYTVTPSYNGCNGGNFSVTATVNPLPVVSATGQTICSNTATNISLSSNMAGTTYSWTVSQTNASGGTNASGSTIAQTLSATTTSAGTATYTVTPSASGCNGSTIAPVVTINPLPVASASSQSICSNTATSIVLSSTVAGTTYAWTVVQSNTSGATNSSGGTIAQTLAATTTSNGTATYTVTPTANGCNGSTIAPVATVKPLPVASASSQSICSNTATSIVLSSTVAGTTYAWTVVQSNTSGATNSSGGTIAQTLAATTTSNGTATYTVTPTASGCNGATIAPVATVKPLPVASASSQTICSGTVTSIVLSSNLAGTTYAWTAAQTNTTGATNSSGGTIAQTLIATTINNGTVTYTVTPTANACNGATIAPVATVKPNPVATAPNQSMFVGGSSNVTITSNLSGTTFTYSVSTSTNVSNATSGSGSTIVQPLTSTDGINPGSATYTVTPTASACTGSTTSCVISVYPVPVALVNGATSSPAVTYYNNFGYASVLSTKTFYYSYQWYNNGVLISGATSSSYTPTLPGAYTVQVTGSAGGILSPFSSTVNVAEPGVQGDSVNSVSQTVFYKAGLNGTTSPFTLQANDLIQKITFTDGLGRAVQVVGVGQSPANGDIIIPTVPGRSGLTDSTFLPYVTSSVQGSFRHNAVRGSAAGTSYTTSEQYLFYQQAATTKLPSDANPFARVVLRNTPDARVIEQGAPGTAWQPGSTHTVINKQYLSTSTLYPVLQWKADGTTTGYYPDNTVWVTKVTDENNHRVIVYKNKLGQTVLKQVRADAATWLLTYYIYDNYGQLIYQIPPKAMSILGGGTSLNANVSSVAELIYKYTYDARGRLIQKKVPGSAVSYTVYDQLDRVVLTQDANQRAQGVWMFVKYDYKNRPVYIGQMASASDRATLQSQFDAINYSSQPYFETPAVNATYQGYTNNVFPTTGLTVLSAYYYDNYDFDRNGTADYAYDNTHLAGLPATASTATRGLPTGSKKLILGTANWLVAAKFYDNLDRPLQTQSNNHLNLLLQDKTSVLYFTNNLSTKVQKIKSTHTGTTTVSVTQRYTYDNGWRPVGIYHTINANAEQQVAAYQYNALGQVVMKQLHNTGAAFMQNVDLRYNIRGWLTSINNAQLASDANVTNGDTNDYFGMELFYNNAETSSLGNNTYFNGNISAIKWKNGGVASGALDQRSYKYNYDSCDRLLSATFQANSGSAWNKETGTLNETMTYDANGNIATLLRTQNQRGLTGTTVTSAAQTIDNLSYTYSSLNPNRLAKVDDASGSALGFTDGTPATNEYKYDTLGNLTVDKNKGISAIAYNVLGKPTQITYSNGNTIVYTYDAAGTKLKMASTVSGITTTTDYVNGFVYANAALSFFPSPEGRVVKNGGNYEYQYALTDHQGNTRVVFTSAVQTVQSVSAGFETANQTTEASNFSNYPTGSHINTVATNAHGGSNSLYLNGGPSGQVGVAKSYKVFAGDQLSIQAYAKYLTPSGTGSNLAGFATALLGAFGLSAPVGGETGTPSAGINTWGGIEAGGYGDGSTDNVDPKVFVTIVIFDKNYKFLDVAYQQLTTSGALMSASYKVKEAGYAFMYVSNEHPTQVDVYFDDVTMSYTPSNIIQSNEFLPFGLQTANSWTRDSNTGNNFLANGGTELNTTTQVYDLAFRNYDATLGRMNQVDPFADMMGSFSPYHFAFNNPVGFNDPSGLIPPGAIAYGTWDAGSDWNMGTMDQIRAIGGGGGKGALPDGVYYDQQRNPYSVLNGTVYIPSPGYKNDPNFDMVPAQEIIDLGDPNQNQRYVARAMAAMNAVGDYLDPSTIGHNLFWLSYPGGNNPHSYNGEDNFTYKPKNKAEFPAIGHDRRYYNVGASGATGLLTNTKTIGADWLFVAEELSIANDPSQEFEDRVAAFILGKGLGALAYPKTVYQLIFNPSAIIPDFIQSNKGVTNSPTSTGN